MSARTNPIFDRLTQNRRWPSMNQTYWAAGILFVYNLVAVTISFLVQDPPDWLSFLLTPSIVAAVVGWVTMLTSPIMLGIRAAEWTSRDVRTEAFQLIRLTNLTQQEITRGYMWASLFRVRFLLAIMLGCLPAALGWIPLFNFMIANVMYSSLYYVGSDIAFTFRLIDVLGSLAGLLSAAFGYIVLNLLAAGLGAWLALRWKRERAAALITMFIVTMAVLIGSGFALSLYVPMMRNAAQVSTGYEPQYFSDNPTALGNTVLMGAGCALLPGLLTAAVLRLTQKRKAA